MNTASSEESRKLSSRQCEVALQKVGKAAAETFAEAASKDALLQYILQPWQTFMPGFSIHGYLIMHLASSQALLGPISPEYITAVKADDGSQSVWRQPSGDFWCLFAGPGMFKSGTQNIAAEAAMGCIDAVAAIKDSLGGACELNQWVSHFDRKDTMFRDGSTSHWFERLKANPKLWTFLYLCDELDVVLKRVRNDKSAGELFGWLALWNTGSNFTKATGQIHVHRHHMFGIVSCLGQLSAAFDMGCDEDREGRGFSPRFIMAVGYAEARKYVAASIRSAQSHTDPPPCSRAQVALCQGGVVREAAGAAHVCRPGRVLSGGRGHLPGFRQCPCTGAWRPKLSGECDGAAPSRRVDHAARDPEGDARSTEAPAGRDGKGGARGSPRSNAV